MEAVLFPVSKFKSIPRGATCQDTLIFTATTNKNIQLQE